MSGASGDIKNEYINVVNYDEGFEITVIFRLSNEDSAYFHGRQTFAIRPEVLPVFMDYDDTLRSMRPFFSHTGHGWYNRLMLVTCCVITNAVALDMFGFSVVVAAARCDLALGPQETGLLASAPFAGLMFAFPWGYFADVYGRKKALLLSSSIGFFFAACSSLSTSWQLMLALKLIGCCFSTPGLILTIAYLGECTGNEHRSRYMFYMNSMNLASEIVSFGTAFFVLPLKFNVPLPWLSMTYRSWRLYTLILAFPLGLGALMLLFLHESPKFLASSGQTIKALEVIKKIYTSNGGKKTDYPVFTLREEEDKGDVSFCGSVVKQTAPLFQPPLLWRTLQLSFLMAVCCATNNVFLMWFPTVVNIFFISLSKGNTDDAGFCERIKDNATVSVDVYNTDIDVICDDTIALNAIYSGIIVGFVLTLLNLSVSKIASYRRLILMAVLLLASVSCVLVGYLKHPQASLIFFALIQSTAVGLSSIASYFVDLYPTSHRGLASALTVMVARLSSFVGVIALGNVIIYHCSLTFYCWASLTLGGVAMSLLLPSDQKANVNT